MIDMVGVWRESPGTGKSRITDCGTPESAVPPRFAAPDLMKRLLITILTIAFLALAATAYAQQCGMTTRIGSNLASKATKGPCTVARSKLLGTATLHCGDGAG